MEVQHHHPHPRLARLVCVTDFGSGAAFVSKRPSVLRAASDEIKSEIAIIKQRQTPVKKSLETKFDLQDGPRVTTAPNDVFSTRVAFPNE